jgi:N-acetylglucosaminyldiphosphoundecaprenol N-acetyl-beta-D-mannosaminyltransferase
MTALERVRFLGIDFDPVTTEGAIAEIFDHVKQPFRFVVTPNVHHVVNMHEAGDRLWTAYSSAWRVYCDSRVLKRLARMCGLTLTVVTGSDLTAGLIAKASAMKMRIGIVGPSAADCALLGSYYPGLDIVSYAPPMGFIKSELETQKCVDFVAQSDTDLTFLAVGMPQQEMLAQRIAKQGNARGVGLCIGASIDFLTKKQIRAPLWVQQAGMEWTYRLVTDPKRLARRYLIECPKIFPLVIAHVLDARQRR